MTQQPQALKILFLTEMWERYGFYTLQAMLVLYMIKQFSFADVDAYAFLGQFSALVYLMPVLGGWVADRFLGNRIAVLLGGLFLCLGYALLALGENTLLVGLTLVIMGNGLLKPNISGFLGEFYTEEDSRREAGFLLFYVGINIGSLLATLCAGYIQKFMGWGACFGAAAFALLLGISVFRWGFRYFDGKGFPPETRAKTLSAFLKQKPIVILWFSVLLVMTYYLMSRISFGNYGLYTFIVLFCLYVAKIAWQSDTKDRRHIIALMLLFAIVSLYKGMFLQMYFVINVFTDRVVDRTLMGHEIPAAVFLGLDNGFIILLGPILARIWQSNKIKLSIPFRFVFSLLIMGACMQILATLTSETDILLPAIWMIPFYLFFTMSELFILPLGLSVVAEYAPKNAVGLMMGGWFLSAGLGGKLSGILAGYADVPKGITDLHSLNVIYHHAFQQYALFGFILFVACLMLVPIIRRLLASA